MEPKQPIRVKVTVLCGVFAPIVAFTCIGLAIYYSPWFTWTGNWLSDLGGISGEKPIWAARGVASVIFNFGLIITGIMGLMFASVVRKISILNTRLGRIGTLLLVIDISALTAIGIFPETTGYLHSLASIIFFSLIPLSLLPIGFVLRNSTEKLIGLFVILIGIISLCSLSLIFIPQPWGGNAIAEMFPIVSIAMFAIVMGISLLKGKFELNL